MRVWAQRAAPLRSPYGSVLDLCGVSHPLRGLMGRLHMGVCGRSVLRPYDPPAAVDYSDRGVYY
ncbi:MAG: hypothetical protein OHK0046_51780 [Anaerolineae bacterium]